MPLNRTLAPEDIASNLLQARKRAGLTQEALAQLIGVSRPILVAIESGQRRPTELQVQAIASALGASVHNLLSLTPSDEAVSARLRAVNANADARPAIDALEEFGRRYARLEELANDRIERREPPAYSVERAFQVERAAEELATSERLRLGLGDGPLPELRRLFEEDAGLRIFGLDELRSTKISGLFFYSRSFGPLVGFNSAHDSRRIRWTLCHEYAHYVTDRFAPEITEESTQSARKKSKSEVFADTFAACFLMPTSGVTRRFSEMLNDAQGAFKVSHLVLLARYFEVSFQAITRRLQDLGCIERGTYEFLIRDGFKPAVADAVLGIQRTHIERLPFRYVELTVALYDRGMLSEGDVAAFLRLDRLAARDFLRDFRDELKQNGELGLGLDTAVGVTA